LRFYDSPQEKERHETSVHEAAHAGYAAHCGYSVLEVDIARQRTLYRPPFTPEGLSCCWHDERKATQQHLTQVLGIALAPYVHAGALDGLDEGDAAHVQMWQHAWDALSSSHGHPPAPWNMLVNSARRHVILWLARPGVESALELLAFVLRRDVRVTVAQWQRYLLWPDLQPLRPRS
jgi:hypothetical protein